jgi:hypothetical protein
MKKHVGGLTAYLNQATLQAAEQDTGVSTATGDVIVDIDVTEIEANEKNFYGLRGIESLAGMIMTAGYISPVEVKENEDKSTYKYKLIAGHRRRKAKMLLLERGEHIDPKIPAIIRKIEPKGCLSADEVEEINVIFSNRGQRQDRTAGEKLEEAQRLEPIAQKIFEEERKKGHVQGSFRKFFAEEALAISESAWQRLKSLEKLIPEAKQALDEQRISETAAATLAMLSVEEQQDFLEQLKKGETRGTVAEVHALRQSTDDEPVSDFDPAAEESNENDTDEPLHEKVSETSAQKETQSEVCCPASQEQISPALPLKPSPASVALLGETADQEAENWLIQLLQGAALEAEKKMKEAQAAGQTMEAAKQDFRRTKVNLVIETIKA